jgi:PPOX class probable F420-dependent enzyme
MIIIPEKLRDLLQDDVRAFAMLATLMKDGSPQVTPVWFNYKDGYFFINSSRGRQKDINMRRSPRVAFAIVDPKDPYRYLQIRGKIVEITENGANEHINFLSQKYTGHPFNITPDMVRVIYKIEPEHAQSNRG